MAVNPAEPRLSTGDDWPGDDSREQQPLDAGTFWKRLIAEWFFWGFWLTALYVLSIGPAYWLWHRAYYTGEEPFYTQLYFPLMFLSSFSETVANWLEWYISLWVL